MYSTPYEDVSDRMRGLFVGRRPDTLIGAPRDDQDHHSDQHLYANGMQQQYQSRVPDLPMGYTNLPSTEHLMMTAVYPKRMTRLQSGMFNRLPDGLVLKIFSFLDTTDLLLMSQVCKRFQVICWSNAECWRAIHIKGDGVRGDKVLKTIFKRLCDHTLPFIERVHVSNGAKFTDKSLGLLSRRCPELTHLQVQNSIEVFDSGVTEILNKCVNLQHLDLTGCPHVSNLCGNADIIQRQFPLQYLDLTDCISLDDCGIQNIVSHCPSIIYLYLRRCVQITDVGLKSIAAYCNNLRELSISDCTKVTDYGMHELAAKVGSQLRYLSVAKCVRVTDAGLKMIARRCYKLRYLNTRGCPEVTDESIICLARSCRLRALDIGGCEVTDEAIICLARSCPNLKKLSLRNCDMISDIGLNYIGYFCRGLMLVNIQDCPVSIEGYRSVKMYCKRCVIEHSNPGFG